MRSVEADISYCGTKKNKLVVFNSPYRFINEDGITNVCQKDTSLSFYDGEEQYIFYPSKSVLQKRFEINLSDCMVLDVDILKDPYAVLMERIGTDILHPDLHVASSGGDLFSSASDIRESVVLPLYSLRAGGTVRYVPERSGLNQWNASGRMRDPNEVYIPIPQKIHKQHPSFSLSVMNVLFCICPTVLTCRQKSVRMEARH